VVVDSREQAPYHFQGVRADAKGFKVPIIVRTVVKGLETGDYSIVGLENRITIERKSLADAYGTFGDGRERFERELERMRSYEYSAVVIEAGWEHALNYVPPIRPVPKKRFTSKHFFRSVLAWDVRYPTKWYTAPTAFLAERIVFRLLQRFWTDMMEREKEAAKAARMRV
jgi:hypothetical protein